ncbi:MAG: hypothetical protein R3F11_22950 [Verrucomicrobiales bacterium]
MSALHTPPPSACALTLADSVKRIGAVKTRLESRGSEPSSV